MDGWQPIETAPKDGTRVDLWCVDERGNGHRRVNCSWEPMRDWAGNDIMGWRNMFHTHYALRPTHWHPIPDPPDYHPAIRPTEESLQALMRDPRYWRDRDPEFVRRVTSGYRAMCPD